MSRRVIVIGSGAAGTAAAHAARAAGADVTVLCGGPGASSLTSGALDGHEPKEPVRGALDLYALGPCKLATSAGVVRAARGRDLALCDLGGSSGPVLVARVAHPGWDADALASSFSESEGREYVARDIGLVMHTTERAMKHAELAAVHDDETRLARAAERIREALAGGGAFTAVLLPPWLGVTAARAAALSKHVGLSCGEVLVGEDGPAGSRFEHARDRALAGVTLAPDRATRVTASSDGCRVETTSGALDCDALVLATGGLIAGGIRYTPGEHHVFTLGYDAPVTLGYDGKPLVVPGGVLGVPPESLLERGPGRSPPLERVGVLRCPPRIFAAGDALADQPRTMLAAFDSGARAGRAAAHDSGRDHGTQD